MTENDLDNIVEKESEGVMDQKQIQYDDLLLKYQALSNTKEVLISYSVDLPYDYQRNLANQMLFRLYMDLNKRSTVYKNDSTRTDTTL